MISIDDIDEGDIASFGIFGQSYLSVNSKPSLLELIRYCISDERDSKRLLQLFENNSTTSDFVKFKNKYRGISDSNILQNFLHDIQAVNSPDPDQRLYHSSRRKWLTIVENTELRDYQIECSDIIKSNINSRKSTLLVLPTGAGKTRTVIQSIREILDLSDKPLNILWLVHTNPLCMQAENAIQDAWLEPRKTTFYKNLWLNSTYGSGLKPTINMFGESPSFTISTPDTIEKGNWNEDLEEVFDIIVCDEAHHGINEQNRIFQMWPNSHRIGVTATPSLVKNNRIFAALYSSLAYPESFVKKNGGENWKDTKKILIKKEYLSDYGEVIDKYIDHETDRENLEFNKKKKWSEQPSSIIIAEKLSREMLEKECKRILIFVDGVSQARSIAGFLRDRGINCSAVYGTLSQDERSSRINGFSSGHFQVLVSVNILREGIDVPLVDGILIMRKGTEKEDPMFTQMLGRGLRGPRSNGTKYCLVWHVN